VPGQRKAEFGDAGQQGTEQDDGLHNPGIQVIPEQAGDQSGAP